MTMSTHHHPYEPRATHQRPRITWLIPLLVGALVAFGVAALVHVAANGDANDTGYRWVSETNSWGALAPIIGVVVGLGVALAIWAMSRRTRADARRENVSPPDRPTLP